MCIIMFVCELYFIYPALVHCISISKDSFFFVNSEKFVDIITCTLPSSSSLFYGNHIRCDCTYVPALVFTTLFANGSWKCIYLFTSVY